MKRKLCLVLLLFALSLSACADSGGEKRLTGQVACPEDINPPADAILWLQLNELTGGIPNTLAKQSIPWPGKCPITFEIPYNADLVNSSNNLHPAGRRAVTFLGVAFCGYWPII